MCWTGKLIVCDMGQAVGMGGDGSVWALWPEGKPSLSPNGCQFACLCMYVYACVNNVSLLS